MYVLQNVFARPPLLAEYGQFETGDKAISSHSFSTGWSLRDGGGVAGSECQLGARMEMSSNRMPGKGRDCGG